MLRLDQKGFSLPMALVVLALVGANTIYFMGIHKNSTVTNKMVARGIAENNEKTRLSAYLADQDVCGNSLSQINFYNKDITTLTDSNAGINFDLTRGGKPFLTNGGTYVRGTHQVEKYYLFADPASANNQTKYSLVVEYSIIQGVEFKVLPGVQRLKRISVPLFIEFSGNLITRCYARSDQSTAPLAAGTTNVELAIKNSCSPDATGATNGPNSTAKLLTSGSNIIGCEHKITAQSCPVQQSLNGMVVVDNGQTYTCSATTYSCPTTPTQKFAINLIGDGTASCGTPDPNCGPGSTMIRNGTSISCSQNCPAAYLWNSIAPNGSVTCYERLKPCPAGQYTAAVYPDGSVTCKDIIYKSVNCGALRYATDMDSTYPPDPLRCAGYSKVKTCPGGAYTYVTSLATPTPACVTYTY
ncbi:MAG: hypothetical protein ACXVLQ_01130 [Bacteriovorax sp.]